MLNNIYIHHLFTLSPQLCVFAGDLVKQVADDIVRGDGEQVVLRAVASLDSLPVNPDQLVGMLEVSVCPSSFSFE